jgi:hypothetical protein
LTVGIVSLHLGLRGTAPAFDMRSPEIPTGRRTTRARNPRAQKRNLHAKRNRAIREKLAK